jgi:preprotein translocase subunit YajC
MNFLMSEAWADAPAAAAAVPQGNPLTGLMLPLAGVFLLMYFMTIRPQQKRAKEHKAMIAALAKGDEVVITGGIMGRVSNLSDNYATLEVSEGVNIKIQRASIQVVLPKGTLKAA